jgi:hypothetical protein
MLRWLRSGLLLRILGALLVVSVVPIYLILQFSQRVFEGTRTEVVSRSQVALDDKAVQGLQARAVTLAEAVASFLTEREADARFLAAQSPQVRTYLEFAAKKIGPLWTVDESGSELRFSMPIYREIAFVDLDGREQIKVSSQCRIYPFDCRIQEDAALVDVSRPSNTLYRSETYFEDSAGLQAGEILVGSPVGFHLSSEIAYASAQSRSGERYRGVLRFAAPVFEEGRRIGTLVTAVEMLHLLEFTAHVAPSNPLPQAEIDAREADFSYMVSPQGWAISHPRHFNIYGVDEDGQPVKAINEEDQDQPDNLNRPGDLTLMGFIDPAFPELVRRNQQGGNGILRAQPWGEAEQRALIYATIPYRTGQYDTPAGFGLIVLSTDGDRLHIDAEVLSKQFDNQIKNLSDLSLRIITVTLLAVILLAVTLARFVVAPILRLTEEARIIEAGNWEQVNTAELEKSGGGAEVGQLARVFASMAKQIYARETTLRKQVESLKIVIDEAKRKKAVEEITENEFFQDLARRASEIRRRQKPPTDPKT